PVHLAHDAAGDAHHQRPGRDSHPLRHHRARGDDAAVADVDAVQDHAAHADQALVLDDAAVHDGAVPDPDPLADVAGEAGIHVDAAAVLDVGLDADEDLVHVAAEDAGEPDARLGCDGDVTEHG